AGPAVAALQMDLGLVEKLHLRPPPMKKGNGPAVPLSIGPRMPGRRSGTRASARRRRLDRNEGAAQRAAMEADAAVGRGEQGMVAAHADIAAGMHLGAALADQDVAGDHGLAAVLLDPEAPAGSIAAVA